ncbi:MAG: TetR/AcrR family transcriptional regulator [Phycisphaerae bacterium]|nr:TetR/AcrR family transcriptional regulator [Saprospiraceae bacterium]
MTNKEIILQTALQLFGEQGYDRTPTSQIAKAAGVSEGLIFRHFGNKAGLLAAIIQEGLAHIADTMQPYSSASADPREAILQHIERALTAIRADEKFWRLATKIRFQSEVSAVAGEQLGAVNQFVLKHLTDNFQRLGVEAPEEEALLLFALIDGVCLHWLQDTVRYPLNSMKNLLIKKYRILDVGH